MAPTTMAYVPSRFTVRVRDDNGELILYNSYTGAVGVLPADLYDEVTSILRREIVTTPDGSELFNSLVKGGFLIPQGEDEFAKARKLREFTRDTPGLVQFIILPTETCNFRCVYCYESFKLGRMGHEVREGLKRAARREIQSGKSLGVHWFGGEPTAAMDVIEDLSASFIRDSSSAGVDYAAGMTTNGLNLNDETLTTLLRCRVTKFQITVDGPQQVHDARRKLLGGGGTFDRIIANLEAMAHRPKADDFRVALRVNFDRESRSQVGALLEELSGVVGNDDRFAVYFRAVGAWGGPNDADLPVCEGTSGEIAMFEMHDEALKQAKMPVALMSSSLQPNGSICYASQKSSHVIGSDGRLMKCTVALEDPMNVVGQVRPDGTFDINGEKESLWLDSDETTEPACQACYFRPACQGAHCPLVRIQEHRTPCPPEKKHIKHALKLIARAPANAVAASATFDAD